MNFKKWMQIIEVGPGGGGPGSGLEPPKQDPTKLGGTNAFGDYHAPGSDQLPPVNKSKKKSKKKMRKMKAEGLFYSDQGTPASAVRKKKPWEERGTQRQNTKPQGGGMGGMGGGMPGMGMPMQMKKKSKKGMKKK